MKLTKEQEEILEIDLLNKDKNIVVIKALAGTGKTTTLVEKVKHHPELNFCYLSFNKAIKEDIDKVIDKDNISNLKGYTMHGLSYRNVMKEFGFPTIQNLSVDNIQNVFSGDYGLKPWTIYKVISLFNKYCNQVLSFKEYKEHVMSMTPIELSYLGFTEDKMSFFHVCFDYVEKLYNKMVNKQAGFITHNFYLKYFMDNLDKFNFDEYQVFLFDEAQDLNEPMAMFVKEIVKRKAPLILVGDTHQSIYSFIKSIDVMSLLEEQLPERVITKQLTNSFRFGGSTEIENSCNKILSMRNDLIIGAANYEDDTITTIAYLSRANRPVFSKCLELIEEGTKFDLIGGIDSFDLKTISDIYSLMACNYSSIKNKYIASFNSIDDFAVEIAKNDDIELLSKFLIADICKKKGKSPEVMFNLISENINIKSNIKVGTIHKTKGLGFDKVELMDGSHAERIIGFTDDADLTYTIDRKIYKVLQLKKETNVYEELNILYVGLSRAKKKLYVGNNTYRETLSFITKLQNNELESIEIPHLGHNKDFYLIDECLILSKREANIWLTKAKGKKAKKDE